MLPAPRQVTDPEGDVNTFITDFQERYGSNIPQFFRGTYAAALRQAQRDLVFLLVYIHANENPSSDRFCRNVLLNDGFLNFLSTNEIILWGCDVSKPEGLRVAHTIRATTYPVLALIALKNGSMTIVLRISGARMAESPESVLSSLNRAFTVENLALAQERQRRRAHQAQQDLRREQDREYEESERRDRERIRKKAEEEAREKAAAQAVEQKRIRRGTLKQNVYEEVTTIAETFPTEPSQSDDAVQLVVRLPSGGQQLKRRFLLSDTVSTLYFWVHSEIWTNPETIRALQLAIAFPKQDLPLPESFKPILTDHHDIKFEVEFGEAKLSSEATLRDFNIIKPQALLAFAIEEEDDSHE